MSAVTAFDAAVKDPDSLPDWWQEKCGDCSEDAALADDWDDGAVLLAAADHSRRHAPRVTLVRYKNDPAQAVELARILLGRSAADA